jgi:gliding motility-associated-like protein
MRLRTISIAAIAVMASVQFGYGQCFNGWSQLVEIVVSNPNAVPMSNQPVLITINTASMITSSKLRMDAGDIRFADTDCCTRLDYYVEASTINTSATRFWVEVPAIAANGSRKIIAYYGNAAATSLSSADSTFSILGNDDTGTTNFTANRTFNTKDYSFPVNAATNVWRIISGNAGAMRFKTTSSTNVVQNQGPLSTVNSGTNTFDLDLTAPSGGHPGFFVGSGSNLAIGNGSPFSPPCGGTSSFLGNTDLPPGSNLTTQACGVYPNIKIWYRQRYPAEPTHSIGPELSFSNTIAITAPPGGPTYCSNGLTLTATSGFTTYQWYRGATAIPGAVSSVYIAPPIPGTHAYRCEAILGSCIVKISNTLNLTIQPIPVLTDITPDDACAPTTQLGSINAIAYGNIASFDWNFGDSNTGIGANPFHTYSSHGTYLTTLIATSDLGCKDTLAEPVIIFPKPVADFAMPQVNCDPNAVPIVNNSVVNPAFSSTITNWSWDFGDATTSTQQQPGSHLYTQPGLYTVSLITTTNHGCLDTLARIAEVYPKPVITSLQAPAVCEPEISALMTSTTLGIFPTSTIANYFWDFGDATTGVGANPMHQYTTPGTYLATVIVETNRGCRDTASIQHAYHPKPVITSILAPPVCEPLPTTLSNQSQVAPVNSSVISNYLWDFGDGQVGTGTPISHAYAVSDTYTVRLIVVSNHGCSDTLTTQMDVYPKPVINSVTIPATCWNEEVQFIQNSVVAGTFGGLINSYTWSFGDGQTGSGSSETHHYATAGHYPGALVVATNHGCRDTLGEMVEVYPKPVIQSISVADVCHPESSNFSQASTVDTLFGSVINAWQWAFGDATTGTGPNPTHAYLVPGAYPVRLEVVTNYGCRDTLMDTTRIFGKPVAGFINTHVCEPDPYQPLDTSAVDTVLGSVIDTWSWNFGDGNSSTLQNPSNNYAIPGSYTVSLVVETNFGCLDTVLQVMNYNPKPLGDFTWSTNCWPEALMLVDATTISGGFLTSWNWNFGDGNTDSVPNPQHYYAAADTYQVSLIVGSSGGCNDTIINSVRSNEKPQADFEVPLRCMPFALDFVNTSTAIPGGIASSTWDFGDGGGDSILHPSHAYLAPGTYRVTLVATTDSSCSDTVFRNIVVNPGPTAAYQVNNVCMPELAQFSDSSTGSIVAWKWEFGDGGIDTVANAVHPYASAGTYGVTFVVTTDSACSDTLMSTLEVHPTAIANLGLDLDHCQFDTLTLLPDPIQPGQIWSTGSTEDSIRIWLPATYFIEVTDSNACVQRDTVEVIASPTISLSILPASDIDLCEGDTVILNAAHPDGQAWKWSDGSTDAVLEVDSAGTYTAIVYNSYACRDTDTVVVHLIPAPSPQLGADSAFCEADTFHLFPGAGFTSWQWSTGATDSSIAVVEGGTYSVTVTNSTGCEGTDFIQLVRNPLPVIDLGPNIDFCADSSVVMQAGAGFAAYLWSDGFDGESLVVNTSGSFFVQVTSFEGCTNLSNIVQIIVNELPDVPLIFKDGPILSTADSLAAYQWAINGQSLLGETQSSYRPETDGQYNVVITDSNGCRISSLPIDIIATVNDLSVPQVITPNGDGANDFLFIDGIEFYEENEMVIFNRWGDEVYKKRPYQNEWNGKYQGIPLPSGTYYYVLKLTPDATPIKDYVEIEY